jgi:hypothetical protein
VGVGVGAAMNVPVIEAALFDESGSVVELVTTIVVVKSPWALMLLAVTEKLADSS